MTKTPMTLPDARYMLVMRGDIFEPFGYVTDWAKDADGNRIAYAMSEGACLLAGVIHTLAECRESA